MTMTFELRTYVAAPGKIGALLDRFRDHTVALFDERGMESIGYWVSAENPNVLIYLLRHVGDAEANWDDFRADPRWIKAKADSEVDGSLTTEVTSVFLEPTDFSRLG
jgi:hypothetical protein